MRAESFRPSLSVEISSTLLIFLACTYPSALTTSLLRSLAIPCAGLSFIMSTKTRERKPSTGAPISDLQGPVGPGFSRPKHKRTVTGFGPGEIKSIESAIPEPQRAAYVYRKPLNEANPVLTHPETDGGSTYEHLVLVFVCGGID